MGRLAPDRAPLMTLPAALGVPLDSPHKARRLREDPPHAQTVGRGLAIELALDRRPSAGRYAVPRGRTGPYG